MVHRFIGGGMLRHLPYLADIARDSSRVIVIQKSAQVGATELAVNLALYAADSGYAGRGNVLYLMPTQNMMDDFAQARFDRAIQDSPYLRQRLQPEPPRRKGADSKRLKRIGPGYVFLRGTDSPRQVASVDADLVILDEYDQMAEGALELAEKRIASSSAGRIIVLSTPRYPEAGINALFRQSDQHRYMLICPACGEEQSLTWEENIDTDRTVVVCRPCRAPLDTAESGRWVAHAPGNEIRGYHLSRLNAPWLDVLALVEASASPTPLGQQEFHNSDLGEPFSVAGGGLSLDALDRARRGYRFEDYDGQRCVMGVDVGTKLHVVIREFSDEARGDGACPRPLWFAGIVDRFEQLDGLIEHYQVASVVIDALPEVHKVSEFAVRHGELVRVAWYNRPDAGFESVPALDGRPAGYRLNRVEAMERAFQRFYDGVAQIPADARQLCGSVKRGVGEYYRELLAPQRTLERDSVGNWQARWVDHGQADHFAHAEVYCLYAEQSVPYPLVDIEALNASLLRPSPWGQREPWPSGGDRPSGW